MTMCCIFMSDVSTKVSFFFIKKNKYRHGRHNSAVNDSQSKKKKKKKSAELKRQNFVTVAVINLYLIT